MTFYIQKTKRAVSCLYIIQHHNLGTEWKILTIFLIW